MFLVPRLATKMGRCGGTMQPIEPVTKLTAHHSITAKPQPATTSEGEPDVGLIRRMTSTSTMGLVDYRSDTIRAISPGS